MKTSMMILVLKAMLVLLPIVIELVKSGKIKAAAMDELETALATRWSGRVAAAKKAKENLTDEDDDDNNRANRGAKLAANKLPKHLSVG